jgi:hypothetical protein
MFTLPKRLILGAAALLLLAGCATQAPRLSGSPAYVLSAIDATGGGELDAALEATQLAVTGAPVAAFASVTVDVVRYDSAILGLFYGGPDHAALSVSLTDANGASLGAFDIFVAVDAPGTQADAELAAKAASIISAKAAYAWPVMTPKPKAVAKPAALAETPAIIEATANAPGGNSDVPCVIGADGKCIPL